MNYDEAIRLLHPDTTKDAIREIEENGGDAIKAVNEACLLACEAMERQIKKKPMNDENGYSKCPRCEGILLYCDNYCLDCGQYLNWEEEDDV